MFTIIHGTAPKYLREIRYPWSIMNMTDSPELTSVQSLVLPRVMSAGAKCF